MINRHNNFSGPTVVPLHSHPSARYPNATNGRCKMSVKLFSSTSYENFEEDKNAIAEDLYSSRHFGSCHFLTQGTAALRRKLMCLKIKCRTSLYDCNVSLQRYSARSYPVKPLTRRHLMYVLNWLWSFLGLITEFILITLILSLTVDCEAAMCANRIK